MHQVVAVSGSENGVATLGEEALASSKVLQKPKSQALSRRRGVIRSCKDKGINLFLPNDTTTSLLSQDTLLIGYITRQIKASHWPITQWHIYSDAARKVLLTNEHVGGSNARLADLISQYRTKDGPGRVRLFLERGQKIGWKNHL